MRVSITFTSNHYTNAEDLTGSPVTQRVESSRDVVDSPILALFSAVSISEGLGLAEYVMIPLAAL